MTAQLPKLEVEQVARTVFQIIGMARPGIEHRLPLWWRALNQSYRLAVSINLGKLKRTFKRIHFIQLPRGNLTNPVPVSNF